MDGMQMRRRGFFGAGGAMVVGFMLGARPAAAWTEKPVALDQVDSFLAIDAAGKVTAYVGKVDLGTGVRRRVPNRVVGDVEVPGEDVQRRQRCPPQIGGEVGATHHADAGTGAVRLRCGHRRKSFRRYRPGCRSARRGIENFQDVLR